MLVVLQEAGGPTADSKVTLTHLKGENQIVLEVSDPAVTGVANIGLSREEVLHLAKSLLKMARKLR